MKINKEEFIKLWNETVDIQDLAHKFKTTAAGLSVKACRLRKEGVELKCFKRGTKGINESQQKKFIKLWNEAECVQDVADNFGLPAYKCRKKACMLRKSGIQIKKFVAGRKPAKGKKGK